MTFLETAKEINNKGFKLILKTEIKRCDAFVTVYRYTKSDKIANSDDTRNILINIYKENNDFEFSCSITGPDQKVKASHMVVRVDGLRKEKITIYDDKYKEENTTSLPKLAINFEERFITDFAV
jgi:hypothetical protein